ncbi:MAG: murein biosynthesis integral membrane protein MurJ [Spirochaetales bacterium]|nr:murein biosynthesis integral membrane protein MurJ [Spirochaetales bacterium]
MSSPPAKSLSKSTLTVMSATLLSRILGFVRNAVVGALFGQSWKADVLNAVFNIPFNLRKLMAEGALSTAFIPVLSRSIVQDPSLRESKDLARSLLSFQLVILLPLTALCMIFAQPIISLLAPFHQEYKQALAVELFRWFINYLVLISISAVLMAVLNAHHKFGSPAVSPILFSISVIFFLILLYPTWGVYAQIPGILVGGLAQILFQGYFFRRMGYSLFPKWHFWTPQLRQTVKNWFPALSISLVSLLSQQISISLAATLPEGSVSSMMNAIVFWQLPTGVLSASIVTVFFPRMSRQIAENNWKGASRSMLQGLELQALLLIPVGAMMMLFSEPLVALAFQRGHFTYADTQLTARILSILSLALFTSGIFNYMQRFFFSQNNFKTPFWTNVIWASLDIIVSIILMNTPLKVQGLAWGSAVSFFMGAIILTLLAWKKLDKKLLFNFFFFVLRCLIAIIPVVLVWHLSLAWFGTWWIHGLTFISSLILLGEGVCALLLVLLGFLVVGIRPWRYFRAPSKEVASDA